jgi:hypothetical protein
MDQVRPALRGSALFALMLLRGGGVYRNPRGMAIWCSRRVGASALGAMLGEA